LRDPYCGPFRDAKRQKLNKVVGAHTGKPPKHKRPETALECLFVTTCTSGRCALTAVSRDRVTTTVAEIRRATSFDLEQSAVGDQTLRAGPGRLPIR